MAGFPSPADDHLERRLDLNEHLIRHPAATFFLRVEGDSMAGAGILPGDLIVVDKAAPAPAPTSHKARISRGQSNWAICTTGATTSLAAAAGTELAPALAGRVTSTGTPGTRLAAAANGTASHRP